MREYTDSEKAIREQIQKEKAELDKVRADLERRHREEKKVLEERYEALQERCPHLSAADGPGVWQSSDCGLTEIDR